MEFSQLHDGQLFRVLGTPHAQRTLGPWVNAIFVRIAEDLMRLHGSAQKLRISPATHVVPLRDTCGACCGRGYVLRVDPANRSYIAACPCRMWLTDEQAGKLATADGVNCRQHRSPCFLVNADRDTRRYRELFAEMAADTPFVRNMDIDDAPASAAVLPSAKPLRTRLREDGEDTFRMDVRNMDLEDDF